MRAGLASGSCEWVWRVVYAAWEGAPKLLVVTRTVPDKVGVVADKELFVML